MPFGKGFSSYIQNAAKKEAAKTGRHLSKVEKKEVKNIVVKKIKADSEARQFVSGAGFQQVYDGAGTVLISLTSVAQGLQDNQRAGDELNIEHATLRLTCYNNVGVSANDVVHWRIMVFQYKNSDMNPQAASILNVSNANGGGPVIGTLSARNIDYLNTYNVLVDRTFTTEQGVPNALNYATTGKVSKYMTIKIPMKFVKRKIQYQATTANHTNGLWLLVTTDSGTTSPYNPTFGYDCNINYRDS